MKPHDEEGRLREGVKLLLRARFFFTGADFSRQYKHKNSQAVLSTAAKEGASINQGILSYNPLKYLRPHRSVDALFLTAALDVSSVFLFSFSLELSLKALHCFIHTEKYCHTHNLKKILHAIGPQASTELVKRCKASQSKIDRVLRAHENLFVDVRYPGTKGLTLSTPDYATLLRLSASSIDMARELAEQSGVLEIMIAEGEHSIQKGLHDTLEQLRKES